MAQQRMSTLMLAASIFTFIAAVCLMIAFCSPNWLEKDPRVKNQFIKLGLWEVCFDGFQHPRFQYDRTFTGCQWIFHREYNIIRDYLEPDWFIIVQVFTTLGFLLVMVSLVLITLIILNFCVQQLPFYLFILTGCLLTSFVFNFLAIVIFGAKADGREWMENPQWCWKSWGYGFEIVGSLVALFGALIFFMEVKKIKENRPLQKQQVYGMQPPASHSAGRQGQVHQYPGAAASHRPRDSYI